MNPDHLSDLAITETIREQFARKVEITRMLVRDMKVGPVQRASIFRIKGGSVYALVRSPAEMTAGDVTKTARHMGIDVDEMVPPGNIGTYFEDKAMERFKTVFPSKRVTGEEELRYYKTLVPYSPALLRIASIRGEIREYEPESRKWHVIKRVSYARIQTEV